jgi:hypothetical protein
MPRGEVWFALPLNPPPPRVGKAVINNLPAYMYARNIRSAASHMRICAAKPDVYKSGASQFLYRASAFNNTLPVRYFATLYQLMK